MFGNYNNYGNSSFWLDNNSDVDVLTGLKRESGKDLVQLAAYKRAIANFVQIVTGKSIPVKFQGKESYTDGQEVTIGANLKDDNFDIAVGLALHEGSHISITDFEIIKALANNKDNILKDQIELVNNYYSGPDGPFDTESENYDARGYITKKVKDLLNIVEDRRIDYFIFKNSPGYKGYYHAMYDKYFNAKIVTKALAEGEANNPTSWDDYLFHICNFANPQRNLKTLPALQEVWEIFDLKNISRLGDTKAALDVALEIFNTVEKAIQKAKDELEDEQPDNDNNCPDDSCPNDSTPNENCNGEGEGEGGSGNSSDDIDVDINDDGLGTTGKTIKNPDKVQELDISELTPNQQNQLRKAWEKQKAFISGDVKKQGKLTKNDEKTMDALDKSGTDTAKCGATTEELKESAPWNQKTHQGVDVLVVKDLTQQLIDSDTFRMLIPPQNDWNKDVLECNQDLINQGLSLGNQLGRKLQIRNEENTLKNTRLSKGRIDKRLLASLGYGAENVFSQEFVTKYNDAVVHLSIDVSGSMSGSRLNKSQIAAVAIAKAASMTSNFDVIISYRGTDRVGGTTKPIILIAYDSRKDKISKIKNLFKHIRTSGITPEGLCFEAIADEIVSSSNGVDSYFINFSDGEPYYNENGYYYYGEFAAKHTAKQIKAMKERGIKVLSFFINESKDSEVNSSFKTMYGDSAANIEVNNLIRLAKELNGMFI